MNNLQFGAALREIAAHYEEHPEMPQPTSPRLFIWEANKESFLRTVKELAKGGMVRKFADDANASYPEYHAERDFGGFSIRTSISRKLVCRLVTPAVYECPDSLLEESKEFAEAAR